MYNLSRIGQNRPTLCNNTNNNDNNHRQFGTMGIHHHHHHHHLVDMGDMRLKPEYLGNEHFRFLNNFGLQQHRLIPDKKFVDINNYVNLNRSLNRRPQQSSSSYIVPEPVPNSCCNHSEPPVKTEEDTQLEREIQPQGGSGTSTKQPKKMKRNNNCGGNGNSSTERNNQKSSKKARKQRNYKKSSRRESDRKRSKNGDKLWHKKSLKMEIDEVACNDEQQQQTPPSSPIVTEICIRFGGSPPKKPNTPAILVLQQKIEHDPENNLQPEFVINNFRPRLPSECESEDSFIVFDGDCGESSGSEDEESFEDEESDDGSEEMDVCSIPLQEGIKKVHFAVGKDLCEVHPMVQWSFAYQRARKGPWEEYARDRARFKRRICDLEPILNRVLEPSHRDRIYDERFAEKLL